MAPSTGWSESLAFLTAGLLSVGPVGILAQTSTAQCLSSFNWMDNSKDQDPCLVSAYLLSACNDGVFTIDPLPSGTYYTGPDVDEQDQCECSSITYNAMSACGLCQNRTIIRWSKWNVNCTTIYPEVFPAGIPDGTAVPQWAFQDVTHSDLFNVTLAESVGDNPESTATVQSTGSLSATSISASASLTASASSTNMSSGSSSNTGAIAGGVVGGVVGVALIVGVVVFYLMKKRRSQILPSAQYKYTAGPTSPPGFGYNDPAALSPQMVQPKLYDPSDPSTFPTTPATVTTGPLTSSIVRSRVAGYPATNHSSHTVQRTGHYGGMPEI